MKQSQINVLEPIYNFLMFVLFVIIFAVVINYMQYAMEVQGSLDTPKLSDIVEWVIHAGLYIKGYFGL